MCRVWHVFADPVARFGYVLGFSMTLSRSVMLRPRRGSSLPGWTHGPRTRRQAEEGLAGDDTHARAIEAAERDQLVGHWLLGLEACDRIGSKAVQIDACLVGDAGGLGVAADQEHHVAEEPRDPGIPDRPGLVLQKPRVMIRLDTVREWTCPERIRTFADQSSNPRSGFVHGRTPLPLTRRVGGTGGLRTTWCASRSACTRSPRTWDRKSVPEIASARMDSNK